jgi:hypothetical protein
MKRRLTLGLAIPVTVGLIALGVILHSPASHSLAASSTPPPPPSVVPTPITPPPPPPTNTPAPTATATATTVLGANVRLVASASLSHAGKTATVRWHMAYQRGVKGFRIYAGKAQLTKSMIKAHKSPNYSAKVRWVKHGTYALKVLFKNGNSQRLAVH